MIEVFNIVILLVMFSLLFFSPLSKRFYDNIYKNYQYNIFDLATLNLVIFLFILFALVKAIVPRYRYDQLMRLGWKIFLPLSLTWVVLTARYLFYFNLLPTN